MEKVTNDVILVSIDFNHGEDADILIVGRKRPNGSAEIINAFQGQEARDLYEKLAMPKKKEESDGEREL